MTAKHFVWTMHVLGAAATAISVLVFGYFVYRPLSNSAAEVERNWIDNAALLSSKDEIQQTRSRLRKTLADNERSLTDLNARIPETAEQADFLGLLAESAEQAGIEIQDFRPMRMIEKDYHHEFEVHVVGEGEYTGLCHFLDKLRQLSRLNRVQSLTINAREPVSEHYPFVLVLRVYFSPLDKWTRNKKVIEHG